MRQSFSYTLLITWVLIAVSCKNHFVQKSYEIQNISVTEEQNVLDSSIVRLYLPYKNILEKDMNRVISFSEVEMTKGKPESFLTNFLGDLLLNEGGNVAKAQEMGIVPDLSFFNYGGIRTSLPEGEITVGKIFELMPFENEMVFLELDGKQTQEFLDYVAAKGGDSLGGARFKISEGKAKDATIGGKPISEQEKYWLVTNDYVANGGDGLDVLKGRKQFINSKFKIRDAIISSLEEKQKNNEKLTAKIDGRFIVE
ncbi:5'-nucleotidase [Prolixibacteraceae bacterium Z1-6]|uniref:5'-nucleotidase n=1 Tax=Draconibacterium aestuarii TaxID=2998507 RepID=A0A9X3F2D8_9BACT|nr:5'-nucleotidase [Prolixibacteraceae bacterium Z1-6]